MRTFVPLCDFGLIFGGFYTMITHFYWSKRAVSLEKGLSLRIAHEKVET